jgi:hypothetical protein
MGSFARKQKKDSSEVSYNTQESVQHGKESWAVDVAERSTKIYESNKDRVTERPAEKFEDDRVSQAEDLKETIEKNEHTEEDVHKLNYNASVIMSALTLNNMAKVLDSAGYSNRETRKILEENYKRAEDAYVQARMQGKSDEEAREAARKAQRDYLSTIYSSLDKKHQKDFEKAVGDMLGQQEVGALALESGNEDAINDAFNAKDSKTQKGVAKKYGLMKDFAIDAFFDSLSAVFTIAGALGASAGPTELGAPESEVSYYLDEVMQKEQWQQEETGNFEALDEMIAELIEEDKRRGKSSNDGEAPKVADLDGEMQGKLEKFGVSADTTLKDAAEIMENARKDTDRVGRLSTPEYFVKDEGGNLVLAEDDREGVQYTKRPEFTPANEAVKLIEYDRKVIEAHAQEFFVFSAREFAPSEDKMGTAKIVSERYDFSQADSPESIVLNALLNPADKEARQEAVKVLENPANFGVRAALLEANVRAVTELLERHGSGAPGFE